MIPLGAFYSWIHRIRSHPGARWGGYVALALVLSWLSAPEAPSQDATPKERDESSESIDTLIPAGMVLVPLQISNSESLDSIIGKFAVVDIYKTTESSRFRRPLMRSVKLLRAPKNPKEFGVLAPLEFASALAGLSDPVFVTVQNPTQTGPHLERAAPQTKRRIEYEE